MKRGKAERRLPHAGIKYLGKKGTWVRGRAREFTCVGLMEGLTKNHFLGHFFKETL